MNTKALEVYCAFSEDGTIDYKKSAENLIADLQSYEAVLEVTGEKVKDAILAVFEKYKGTNLNVPALTNFTMQELAATPENYAVYQNGIKAFIKANQGTRESGAVLCVRKGIGGGASLWADKPLTAEEKATAAAAAAAAEKASQ